MNTEKLMRSQSGQILMYTTIIVMLAALILVPLMDFAFTSHRSVKIREERTLELYASDAGIEDALYQIRSGNESSALASLGFGNASYNPGTPGMNDRTENVSVEKVWLPEGIGSYSTAKPGTGNNTDRSDSLQVVGEMTQVERIAASDDFSSGGWSGSGSGDDGSWKGDWTHTGTASVVSSGGCDGGTLKFADSPGTASRTANLLNFMNPDLTFSAKAWSLEAGDTVNLNVTYGNSTGNYTKTLASWTDGNETSGCNPYDFDLYDLYGWNTGNTSSTLKIAFDANFSIQTNAEDNFSTGTWTGGSGWYSSSWTPSGSSASVVSTGDPHSDSYHVQLSGAGSVMRRVTLAAGTTPQITLWAKTSSFGTSDTVTLQVSTQTTPTTWSNLSPKWTSSSSPSYTLCSPYNLSSYAGQTIWIRLLGAMSTSGTTIASDGFESGWPSSGSGWAGSWTTSTSGNGAVDVVTGYARSGGTRSLQLSRSGSSAGTASATRVVNVSGRDSVQLQYYARSRNIESSGDNLFLQVSPDNVNWTSTTIIGNTTSYNSSYSSFTYTVPQSLLTTGLLYVRFYASMTYSSSLENSSNGDYFYIDDIKIVYFPCFYFDDVIVTHAVDTEGDSFYVDTIKISDNYYKNSIKIGYVVGPDIDRAYLDTVGVWMPAGCTYANMALDETTDALEREPMPPLSPIYSGGTILEWNYGNSPIDLSQPVGVGMGNMYTRELTFVFKLKPGYDVSGMFIWIQAYSNYNFTTNKPYGDGYVSWDKGYEIYAAVSKAHSEIYGSNTQVTAYVAKGYPGDRLDPAIQGDYVAVGNPLLIDYNGDSNGIKERIIDPADSWTWTWNKSPGRDAYHTYYYDGRAEIGIGADTVPPSGSVASARLYWSAFMNNSDWISFGSKPDGNVSFMYPKRYGPESFNSASQTYTVNSCNLSPKEYIDLLAYDLGTLTLSNIRYLQENLGSASAGNSTPDSWLTAHKPVSSPALSVWVNGALKTQSGNYTYTIDSATGKGNITIINTALFGPVKIDYTTNDTRTLYRNTDYTIGNVTLTAGASDSYTEYTGININSNIINSMQGTVIIDHYYAKHWQNVGHTYTISGSGNYPPVSVEVPPGSGHVGHTYVCYADVTDLLTGNNTYTYIDPATGKKKLEVTGNGQYAVTGIMATTPPTSGGDDYNLRCFSGWSLIVVYNSAFDINGDVQKAHKFYLRDPIHLPNYPANPDDCPFQMVPDSETVFNLTDFYPPGGVVTGKTTYFVGEGDSIYPNDYVQFKGASQSTYTTLWGPHNPEPGYPNQTMNTISTDGARGIDIDTFDVTGQVGNDTKANVKLHTEDDRWYLAYIILSFRTSEVPTVPEIFDVSAVTYQYELGRK